MNKPHEGRLVWNHSTHLPGLIPLLEKLIKYQGIKTVTPGVITTVRGRCPHLKLRVSVPICGGYKIIARLGKTVQEVFVVTTLEQVELEAAIAKILN
jgi:hypothetical protein